MREKAYFLISPPPPALIGSKHVFLYIVVIHESRLILAPYILGGELSCDFDSAYLIDVSVRIGSKGCAQNTPPTMAYRYRQNYESSVHNIKGIFIISKDPHNLSIVHKIYQTVKSNFKIAYKILKKQYLDDKSPHTIRNKHLS